jgi:hypothetical protein
MDNNEKVVLETLVYLVRVLAEHEREGRAIGPAKIGRLLVDAQTNLLANCTPTNGGPGRKNRQ